MIDILEITCGDIAPFMRVLAYLLKIVKIAVPIILILLIILDFAKAVIANDEKKMNESKNIAVKRLVYALCIFLVPTIVSLVFRTVGSSIGGGELAGPTDWISCYNRFN